MKENRAKEIAPDEAEAKKITLQFRMAAIATLAVLGTGMVFYHHVQHLSWIDALYFCVVTLTTIGYGDIVPVTNNEKLFTTVYILIGLGIMATFVNLLVKRAVVHRSQRK
ncbi:potassium channel family protein [Candidatus Saccharibacteria bacterium]|nr:potassium channel family protein [Candidatus Saccharibacteria bacterium]